MLDTGNTAWITMATILVMMMTVPALALFYGGVGTLEEHTLHPHALPVYNSCLQHPLDSLWL